MSIQSNHESKRGLPVLCLVIGLGLIAASDSVRPPQDCEIGHMTLTTGEQVRLAGDDRAMTTRVVEVLTQDGGSEPERIMLTVNNEALGLEYNDLLFRVSMTTVQLVDLPPAVESFIPVDEVYSDAVAAGDVVISSERC